MKTISLWQPWASAVAMGVKTYETRHWRAPGSLIGQRIAIHAAKRPVSMDECELQFPLWGALVAMIAGTEFYDVADVKAMLKAMPRGFLVASAVLARVVPTTDIVRDLDEPNLLLGNWAPGRYAWQLTDIVPMRPVRFCGSQGFFNVPDKLIEDNSLDREAIEAAGVRNG